MLILSIVLFLHLSAPAGGHIYNATTDADHVVGAYPISGQYGLLNRLLFYTLWIFVLCLERWTWPAIGALAYIMTYSATAAVHALILAITSVRGLYDLDSAGAWAILSSATTIIPPIIWFSNKLRDSVYRPIFGFWATVVGTGCICAIAALLRDYPEEPTCWSTSSNGSQGSERTMLASPMQLFGPGQFNCTYEFFNTSQPLRSSSQIVAVPDVRVFGTLYKFWMFGCVVTVIFGVVWSVLGCCLASDRRRTKPELEAVLKRKLSKNALPKRRHMHNKEQARARNELETGMYQNVSFPVLYLNPLCSLVVVAFNEAYILGTPPLPSSDPLYSIGQWGSWVAVALASIAAAINAWYEPRWEKLKHTLDAEQEERLQEKQRKAIPQIQMDLETGFLSKELQTLQQKHDSTNEELAAASSGVPLQQTHNQDRTQADDRTNSSAISVTRPASIIASNTETSRVLQRHESNTNFTRACFRVPRTRNRLENIQYGPPFELKPVGLDLASAPLQQWDVLCRAYDEVGTQHDGIIIRDVEGRDWVVQRGILWHRELWESP